MPNMPIDLGKASNGPCCVDVTYPPAEKKKYYPSLYLDWDDEYHLPKSGTMVVRFHKRSETTRETDKETSQSVELEILSIEDVKADKDAKKDRESGGEALDKYKEELE